ncbi:MAG: hypothetical protein GQE15_27880 [Archangiaceae bacterium]|nr:hypothetical protein [Archangiaceae bacterium]
MLLALGHAQLFERLGVGLAHLTAGPQGVELRELEAFRLHEPLERCGDAELPIDVDEITCCEQQPGQPPLVAARDGASRLLHVGVEERFSYLRIRHRGAV